MEKQAVWYRNGRVALALTAALGLGTFTAMPTTVYAAETSQDVATEQPADNDAADGAKKSSFVQIKESPDKYTWYVKNYVGMNAASVGYTSLGGDRRDKYGAGNVELVLVTADGSYIDPTDEEALKDYVVVAQNLEPNTELKYTFQTNSKGEEYSNLTSSESQDEIVLELAKVGSKDGAQLELVATESSDKHTRYVKSYVGRNLAACGYTSLGGDLRDHYGESTVKFLVITDDGSYVDPTDTDSLKQYRVVEQSVEPNTPIALTFMTDSSGKEYDNLVDSASIEEISLLVERIDE